MIYQVTSSFIDSKQRRYAPGDNLNSDDYSDMTIKHYLNKKMIEEKAAPVAKKEAPKAKKIVKPTATKAIAPDLNK